MERVDGGREERSRCERGRWDVGNTQVNVACVWENEVVRGREEACKQDEGPWSCRTHLLRVGTRASRVEGVPVGMGQSAARCDARANNLVKGSFSGKRQQVVC